jgi:RNA polymerase subunit RPABC4/transcription elongation factor Spt4
MKPNFPAREYQETVCAVIEALLRATADSRLPALTSDEIHHWLTHLTLQDASEAVESLRMRQAPVTSKPSEPLPGHSPTGPEACMGCGTSLPATAKFCPECGRTVTGSRHCLNCNAIVSEDAKFCPSCGFRLALTA